MEELIKKVKSLLADIESVQMAPGIGHEGGQYWFGPFSEFDNNIESVTVEWPNLAISAQEVKVTLAKLEASL